MKKENSLISIVIVIIIFNIFIGSIVLNKITNI